MRQYVIWLIFLQICSSEDIDYSDYHPKNIPLDNMVILQAENPASDYSMVMKSLCDNWQSPIDYLKNRGYMPSSENGNDIENENLIDNSIGSIDVKKKEIETVSSLKGDNANYFFFPQDDELSFKDNFVAMADDDDDPTTTTAQPEDDIIQTDPPSSTEYSEDEPSNDSSGLMDKVKDKFLSIFSVHKDSNTKSRRSNLLDRNYDVEDPDMGDNSNDYDVSNRRLYARSATEKPSKIDAGELLSNLSDADIQYIKSFINCFKQTRTSFPTQASAPASDNSTTTSSPSLNATSENANDTKSTVAPPSGAKQNDSKPTGGTKGKDSKSGAKPSDSKPNATQPVDNSTECILPVATTTTTYSPIECPSESLPTGSSSTTVSSKTTTTTTTTPKTITAFGAGASATTTTDCIPPSSLGSTASKTASGSASAGKSGPDDFTVDLDINQKNGTGEDAHPTHEYAFVPIALVACPKSAPLNPSPNPDIYIIKSKFLAHLHHMVDEVGKPPHKPLDLSEVQDVIDKTKHSTVIMSDTKSTECAPLRLNDMSFDLEWNKYDDTPDKDRGKMSILDYPAETQQKGQSLAEKFLQDVDTFPDNNEEYLKTPYGDNFLDSQQTLPDNFELPLKLSTKREAGLPSSASHGHKLSKLLTDIASLPDSDGDDDYYSDDEGSLPRRRIKGRLRNRPRNRPKNKLKPGRPSDENDSPTDTCDGEALSGDKERRNEFSSFDELKDIQFRVNDDDEAAISTFIANLNSPPEVFSFDVDKYLRSAQIEMEPRETDFEIQSPEPRTFYEFLQAPAVEKETLPMIEAPVEVVEEEPLVEKRAKKRKGKRDLLRQYIKGVSNALHHHMPELSVEYRKANEAKAQRSPNLDTDLNMRTNNLIDGFSTNLDAMNYIKSNDHDDFLDNFYLLNDGSSQMFDLGSPDPDMSPNDKFSPQSLEIDLELDKKFRELGIGAYAAAAQGTHQSAVSGDDVKSVDGGGDEAKRHSERRHIGSRNG